MHRQSVGHPDIRSQISTFALFAKILHPECTSHVESLESAVANEKDRRITAGDLGEDVSMDEMMTNKALLQVVESGSFSAAR